MHFIFHKVCKRLKYLVLRILLSKFCGFSSLNLDFRNYYYNLGLNEVFNRFLLVTVQLNAKLYCIGKQVCKSYRYLPINTAL